MKFRIKIIKDLGHFAQVYFRFKWHTIGAHHIGFGLYPEDHREHPIGTYASAQLRCYSFAESKKLKPTYSKEFEV